MSSGTCNNGKAIFRKTTGGRRGFIVIYHQSSELSANRDFNKAIIAGITTTRQKPVSTYNKCFLRRNRTNWPRQLTQFYKSAPKKEDFLRTFTSEGENSIPQFWKWRFHQI